MMMEERKLNVSHKVAMATESRIISIISSLHNKVVSPTNQSLSEEEEDKYHPIPLTLSI